MNTISPTPYPDVNEIVSILLRRVQAILGDQLVGLYLDGSLANGGFDEHSDIDVIVVTAAEVSEEVFLVLKAMHEQIARLDSPWAVELEVSYIPQNALHRFDPGNNLHPNLERGASERLKMLRHESDWIIHRHILRERGIVVAGPDPRTLVDPISPDDLRRAVVEGVPIWVNPLLQDPSELRRRGFQSFFVLSLCRMIYTLKYGDILPKQAAAEWGRENLEPHWRPLIERALLGRQNPGMDADPEDLLQTLDMMRYTLEKIKPTPYVDMNEVLNLLRSDAKEILGDLFLGMYLYGSLASGDFHPESSDIDFLVVTTDTLPASQVSELEAMHNRLWAGGLKWASKLEGAYVPKDLIRRHTPEGPRCPTVNEGKFYVAGLGSDWIIQRHIVREYGTALEGPDPKTLIDPVTAEEIRDAVLGVLHEWWFPMLDDPAWLSMHGNEYHAFAILTMCRALYALEHGTIVSKTAAARWAQTRLGGKWSRVIEQAIRAQTPGNGQVSLLQDALELIQHTKEIVNK
jgi:predicted nucleotidyltransferase